MTTKYEAMREALERINLRASWFAEYDTKMALVAEVAGPALSMPEDAEPCHGHAEQVPTFLAGGTRYKVTFDNRQSDARIYGLPKELNGCWVALVDATDNRHILTATKPEAQQQDDIDVSDMPTAPRPEVQRPASAPTNRQIYAAVLHAMQQCAADEPPASFEEFMISCGQSVVFLREFAIAIEARTKS